jgi:hypothetical protein
VLMEYFSSAFAYPAAFRGTPAEHAAEEPGLEYVFRRLWETGKTFQKLKRLAAGLA